METEQVIKSELENWQFGEWTNDGELFPIKHIDDIESFFARHGFTDDVVVEIGKLIIDLIRDNMEVLRADINADLKSIWKRLDEIQNKDGEK